MPSAYGTGFGTVYPTRCIWDRSISGVTPLDIVYSGEGFQLFDFEHRLRPIVMRMIRNWLHENPLVQVADRLSMRVFERPIDCQDRGISLDTQKDNIQKHTYFGVSSADPWIPEPVLDTFMQNSMTGWGSSGAYSLAFINGNQGLGGVSSYSRSAQVSLEELLYSGCADQIAQHELLGHCIGRTGDEYQTGFTAASRAEEDGWRASNQNANLTGNFDLTKTLPDPAANVPLAGGRSQIPWHALVTHFETTWPTYKYNGGSPGFNGIAPKYYLVGAFEGARYSYTNWYRSQYNCRMVQWGDPFCVACCASILAQIAPHLKP